MLVITDSVKDLVKDGVLEVSRRHALGYHSLKVTNAVTGNNVDISELDDTLIYTGSNSEEADFNAEYIIVTKEFGLFGYREKFHSDIEVLLADDGVMVITLISGAISVNLNGNPMVITRGVEDAALPSYSVADTLWLNQSNIMAYLQASGAKYYERYPFDYKYFFTISGNGGSLMNMHAKKTSDAIDISLGKFAVIEQNEINRQNAKEAKKLMESFKHSSEDFAIDDDADAIDDFEESYEDID